MHDTQLDSSRPFSLESPLDEGGDFQQYSLNRLISERSEVSSVHSAAGVTAGSAMRGYGYKLDFNRDNSPTLVDPSLWNIIKSALRYVMKQFWLEKRNCCIGSTIIMFIVCMASFIFVFFQNASSLYFFLSQESIGDIDILVSPQPHMVAEK